MATREALLVIAVVVTKPRLRFWQFDRMQALRGERCDRSIIVEKWNRSFTSCSVHLLRRRAINCCELNAVDDSTFNFVDCLFRLKTFQCCEAGLRNGCSFDSSLT